MSKLIISEYPLMVIPSLAVKIGLNEALFVQQLHYWCTTSSGVDYDGHVWIYNTNEQWKEQFPFWSLKTIQRIILKLEKIGIVISGQLNKSRGDMTKFYRIDYEELSSVELKTELKTEKNKVKMAKYNNRSNCPNDKVNLTRSSGQNDLFSTETTTKTTTKINSGFQKQENHITTVAKQDDDEHLLDKTSNNEISLSNMKKSKQSKNDCHRNLIEDGVKSSSPSALSRNDYNDDVSIPDDIELSVTGNNEKLTPVSIVELWNEAMPDGFIEESKPRYTGGKDSGKTFGVLKSLIKKLEKAGYNSQDKVSELFGYLHANWIPIHVRYMPFIMDDNTSEIDDKGHAMRWFMSKNILPLFIQAHKESVSAKGLGGVDKHNKVIDAKLALRRERETRVQPLHDDSVGKDDIKMFSMDYLKENPCEIVIGHGRHAAVNIQDRLLLERLWVSSVKGLLDGKVEFTDKDGRGMIATQLKMGWAVNAVVIAKLLQLEGAKRERLLKRINDHAKKINGNDK